MSSSWTNRTCNICKKLFCCAECCKRHQKKKHPDQEFYCPLCYGEKLPLHPKLDEKLLYHVAVNHLPLYCYLCGDFFEQNKDIELFDPCKFWLAQRRPQVSISERRSLVATPISSNLGTKKKEHSTIDGDYNGNFVGPLTSPPELYRTTSTPMHVAVTGKQSGFEYKTPHVPNFLLKTPNISSATSIKSYTYGSESKSSDFEGKSSSYLTCYTNQDKTPFRSLPSDFGVEEQLSTKNNPGLMLSVMQEQEKTGYITATKTKFSNYEIEGSTDEMELTGVHGGILPEMKNIEVKIHEERRSSSFKKVRFSDQYDNDIESGRCSVGSSNMTENDEYYEARESLSRSTVTMEDIPMKSTTDNGKSTNIDANGFDKNRRESNVDSTSNTEKTCENENNMGKENRFYRTQTTQSNIGVTQKTGCSRVVMMVIVENNSSSGTAHIGPLIESGLKQLSTISDLAECKISGTTRRKSITSMENNINTASYKFYSDSNPVSSQNDNVENSLNRNNSAGLLSSMTHAVKQALKSFPGGNFLKSTSNERMFKRDEIPSSSASSSCLSSFTSCVSNNSRKRSRDFKDEFPSSTRTTDSAVLHADDRSPMAKRHRGWYKIKAREPIARMKNKLTSPRGISSETQIFSQGSLSVGNTIIPIPSRAHQSVQSNIISND
ncbi:hypothetical protein HZH68_006930 [Vespula germanica]|uniref:C2H2-type domain-containing protein n=1 Tax=Vespula germanica TaxID=30212 RepID=A0A834K751_VESGE|nr:hypothetical protein HZH68_006930 [Vespula germanica]